jgi:hydrogenase maturation protein HypF
MKDIKLDAVGMDLHPGYDSKRVAKIFSDKFSVPVLKIQHHWAHAASLLIDNNVEESVILTLDGLGYGSDGNLWGGEVLLSRYDNFKRVGHLENIPLIGGDKATHDPRRIVFAVFDKFKKEKCFYGSEAKILRKTIKNSPISSSMGRVLDALSCYLGICEKRTYDGEPAMKLEKYLAKGKPSCSFDVEIKNNVVNTTNLFNLLDEFCKKDITESKKADISHSFVKSIVDSLTDIAIENAKDQNISKIGLTGGVSYNIPITEMVEKRVKKSGLNLLVHDKIPNGDGGISAGQNVIIGQKLNL